MTEYVCIKELCLDTYDDNGFFVEEGTTFVKEGEVFQRGEEKHRLVGGSDSIRLDSDTKWIEVSEETLNKHFKKR